jgi:hypothetical protein
MAKSTLEIVLQATDKASGPLKQVGKATEDLGKGSKKSAVNMKELGVAALKVTATLAAFGIAAKKAFDLAAQGAAIQQTGQSFGFLMTKVGASADTLDQLRAVSKGTITDMALMSSTATLLAGAQGELAVELAGATPKLLEIAKAAQKLNPALGDTTFLYDSLATGVKRASPMILDNLGLTIRIGAANEAYAESLGKTVEQLTADEQKQALLNETLRAGAVLIEQAGGTTDSATDSYNQLAAATENLTNVYKVMLHEALAPTIGGLAEKAQNALSVTNAIKALRDAQKEGTITQQQYAATVQLMRRRMITADEALSTLELSVGEVEETLEGAADQMAITEAATDDLADAAGDLEVANDDLTWSYQKLFDANTRYLISIGQAHSDEVRLWESRRDLNTVTKEADHRMKFYNQAIEEVMGSIESSAWSEFETQIDEIATSTAVQGALTRDSAQAFGQVSAALSHAASSQVSYGSSVRNSAAAERSLASSIRERLAAQGETIAAGQGIVGKGGALRAPRSVAEHEVVHGEAFSGAGGREGWEHIRDIADDIAARHTGAVQAGNKLADWAGDFLRSSLTPYGGYDEATIQQGLAAAGFGGFVGGAKGLSGIVPGGFPNDSFLIGATSGESVNITPAHMAGQNGGGIVINSVNVMGVQTESQLYDAVVRAARQRGRAFAKVM